MLNILIVDDSQTARMLLRRSFAAITDMIYEAPGLKTALEIVHEQENIHIVTLDLNMPPTSPVEVLCSIAAIRVKQPKCAVVILTGDDRADEMSKPYHPDAVLEKGCQENHSHFLFTVLSAFIGRIKDDAGMMANMKELTDKLFPT